MWSRSLFYRASCSFLFGVQNSDIIEFLSIKKFIWLLKRIKRVQMFVGIGSIEVYESIITTFIS